MIEGIFQDLSSPFVSDISSDYQRKVHFIDKQNEDVQCFTYVHNEKPLEGIVCGKFKVGKKWFGIYVKVTFEEESKECYENAAEHLSNKCKELLGLKRNEE